MPKALFQGIYNDIKRGIETGAIEYQSLLLSEHEFSKQYACSRSTIRRALLELTQDGYVQPIQGKGVRVIWKAQTDSVFATSTVGLESFLEQGRRNGFETTTRVISFEACTADTELAAYTGFSEGDELIKIVRQRLANNKPVSMDITYYLDSEIPGLTPEIAEVSTYLYIERELGLTIEMSKRLITMEKANADDHTYIQPPDDMPMVAVIRSQTFDSDGIMFEHSESRQHPQFFAYAETAARPSCSEKL